jgi:di/tricarboxylate transporter
MISAAAISAAILVGTLALFISGKVRHDLVALLALFATVLTGLVSPGQAFLGFADPAVIAVAAILVVGRAIELSGVASVITRVAVPVSAGFTVRLTALLLVAALLSAVMNNIAALVITMPIATEIARDARRSPGATLMPLAFATILGGMTTLIGTPANLILSSVRQTELGAPLGFFAMTPVGGAVAVVGLIYLAFIGWRLLPVRESAARRARPPWRIFELIVPSMTAPPTPGSIRTALRGVPARWLALHRHGISIPVQPDLVLRPRDRLLIATRANRMLTAEKSGLYHEETNVDAPDAVTTRVVVAHGSFMVGLNHAAINTRSRGRLAVVAVGPRAAKEKQSLEDMRIEAGDQLFIHGAPADLANFFTRARLLEIDRVDPLPVSGPRAVAILAIFGLAIAAVVIGGAAPALAFMAAAVVLAATKLIATDEIYGSIDWSIIVLLAAMIPVGHSFETSGAAAIAAKMLGDSLAGQALPVMLAAICGVTLLLSIFLNNVATAIIMGPLAISAARLLGVDPDAALLAVLIGASADFLTPIGHQNNLLVMGPGGYRFADYVRVGALLVVLTVGTTGLVLSLMFGK